MHVVQLLDSAEFAERFCTSSGLCAKSREERLERGGRTTDRRHKGGRRGWDEGGGASRGGKSPGAGEEGREVGERGRERERLLTLAVQNYRIHIGQ